MSITTTNHILERAQQLVRDAQSRTKSRALPVSLSFDQVKTRARGKWNRLLDYLWSGFTETVPNGYSYGICPVCGKKSKFCCFKNFNESGTCVCFSCHPSGGDGIATVAWLFRCTPNEAREVLSDLLQTDVMK